MDMSRSFEKLLNLNLDRILGVFGDRFDVVVVLENRNSEQVRAHADSPMEDIHVEAVRCTGTTSSCHVSLSAVSLRVSSVATCLSEPAQWACLTLFLM